MAEGEEEEVSFKFYRKHESSRRGCAQVQKWALQPWGTVARAVLDEDKGVELDDRHAGTLSRN